MTALDESVLDRLRPQIGAEHVERLIELFRENVRTRLEEIVQAFDAGDRRGLAVAFHSIKGSAQLVGARRLESVSAHWEETSRLGEIDSVDAAVAQISEAFAAVERVLEATRTDSFRG